MESICNFVSQKKGIGDIKYFHFVYETEHRKMVQPFLRKTYYVYLAVKGTATLSVGRCEYQIVPGTVFFTFPHEAYEIDGSDDLTYLYISFDGVGVRWLFDEFGIDKGRRSFSGSPHITDFWMSVIRRINKMNSYTLTESVLMYTVSFFNDLQERNDRFESILDYIKNNHTDASLSLKKVAEIFFYSDKYFSALFKQKTDVKFTDYINKLRTETAIHLIGEGVTSVSELAEKCGYSDPYYFSRIFKKTVGLSPTQYIKQKGR